MKTRTSMPFSMSTHNPLGDISNTSLSLSGQNSAQNSFSNINICTSYGQQQQQQQRMLFKRKSNNLCDSISINSLDKSNIENNLCINLTKYIEDSNLEQEK